MLSPDRGIVHRVGELDLDLPVDHGVQVLLEPLREIPEDVGPHPAAGAVGVDRVATRIVLGSGDLPDLKGGPLQLPGDPRRDAGHLPGLAVDSQGILADQAVRSAAEKVNAGLDADRLGGQRHPLRRVAAEVGQVGGASLQIKQVGVVAGPGEDQLAGLGIVGVQELHGGHPGVLVAGDHLGLLLEEPGVRLILDLVSIGLGPGVHHARAAEHLDQAGLKHLLDRQIREGGPQGLHPFEAQLQVPNIRKADRVHPLLEGLDKLVKQLAAFIEAGHGAFLDRGDSIPVVAPGADQIPRPLRQGAGSVVTGLLPVAGDRLVQVRLYLSALHLSPRDQVGEPLILLLEQSVQAQRGQLLPLEEKGAADPLALPPGHGEGRGHPPLIIMDNPVAPGGGFKTVGRVVGFLDRADQAVESVILQTVPENVGGGIQGEWNVLKFDHAPLDQIIQGGHMRSHRALAKKSSCRFLIQNRISAAQHPYQSRLDRLLNCPGTGEGSLVDFLLRLGVGQRVVISIGQGAVWTTADLPAFQQILQGGLADQDEVVPKNLLSLFL